MIAAKGPQEFIPSGRQQALRHPGPIYVHSEDQCSAAISADKDLQYDFARVSISNHDDQHRPSAGEWWDLRLMPDGFAPTTARMSRLGWLHNARRESEFGEKCSDFASYLFDDNSCYAASLCSDASPHRPRCSMGSKRESDASSNLPNKRCSTDSDFFMRHDSRSSAFTNKSTVDQDNDGVSFDRGECNMMEEELYVNDHIVIWTRGFASSIDSDSTKTTVCSYSSPYKIIQATWCTLYSEKPLCHEDNDFYSKSATESRGTQIPSIAILDASGLKVYSVDNEVYTTVLNFKPKKVWPCRFGLLFERLEKDDLNGESQIYFVAHPLDDASPVIFRHSSFTQSDDAGKEIVFCSSELNLCMMYDSKTKLHTVYLLSWLSRNEMIHEKALQDAPSMSSCANVSNRFPRRLSSVLNDFKASNVTNSKLSYRASSAASNYSCPSQLLNPISMLRGQGASQQQQQQQGAAGCSGMSSQLKISRLNASTRTSGGDYFCARPYRVPPKLGFRSLWTENTSAKEGNAAATKVFIIDDFSGQWYICYHVAAKKMLTMVAIDLTTSTIGSSDYSMPCKDASPIPQLHMISMLDHLGNVLLYSGTTMVGKLHMGGVLAQHHTPSPFIKRTTRSSNKPGSTAKSPFPRRSSLLPNTLTPRADPNLELLSPVLPHPPSRIQNVIHLPLGAEHNTGGGGDADNVPSAAHRTPNANGSSSSAKIKIVGLRDAIQSRVTLQYTDGSYYRVSIPPIADTPLIADTLLSLRETLPRDVLVMFVTQWYGKRNSPGSETMNLEQEWEMFSVLLSDLLGVTATRHHAHGWLGNDHETASHASAAKRQRPSLQPTDADWHVMITNSLSEHNTLLPQLSKSLRLRHAPNAASKTNAATEPAASKINNHAALFRYIRVVHFTLHLLYEDLKLNNLRRAETKLLAQFLCALSTDLSLNEYVLHYWRDFPEHCCATGANQRRRFSPGIVDQTAIILWPSFTKTPACSLSFLRNLCNGSANAYPFPYLPHVNERTRDVISICGAYIVELAQFECGELLHSVIIPGRSRKSVNPMTAEATADMECTKASTAEERVVMRMARLKLASRDLETLPVGVSFILYSALWACREMPGNDWPAEAYELLARYDLVAQSQMTDDLSRQTSSAFSTPVGASTSKVSTINAMADGGINSDCVPTTNQVLGESIDGMEDIDTSPVFRLRFADDVRVRDTRRMLQSARPVWIVVVQRPDISDHEFIEEQERHLYAMCARTMALPTGRGMFTMRTVNPVITEPLPMPLLCLTGRAPPQGTTVDLPRIDIPPHMNAWPLFHNGVANGLRISSGAQHIDSDWIVFNQPRMPYVNDAQLEHAGFLLALGLNGHLRNLGNIDSYNYLTKSNEMIAVGVLLGLCVSYRGTADPLLTKVLAIHCEALLPPTSIELDVAQNLQVTALMGIGLLYQSTANRQMAEVLLNEIGRPPGPEMENSVDRESFSLASGLALGLVTLKFGGVPCGLSDLNIPETLHYYMVGGTKRALTGAQKDRYKVPSFQIKEGPCVNLDITAPGATLALGLMYLGSNNKAIADWMEPPDTEYLLDFVRPDFLMLRTIARNLIMWDEIEPEPDWVTHQVPESIRPFCMVKPNIDCDLDYEAMNQAYCNIIAGACFAIGLKFAGTANGDAHATLQQFCHMFISLSTKSIAELAGKPTIETCLNTVLLANAMVMAGTGNIEVMRIVRFLRRRVGITSCAVVTYGSHLAVHMALGLLFLGGGRYTLSNSPTCVAALLCSFYPKFPTHSNDNRYHLQAFRHLYVLAVEPRLVIPREYNTERWCYATLRITHLDGKQVTVRGPAIIPALDSLLRVSVCDERYWPITFEKGRNWETLINLLCSGGCVEVKQRAGCLSYADDKLGYRSDLAHLLTNSRSQMPWQPGADCIDAFSSDVVVKLFTDSFLRLSCNSTTTTVVGSAGATPSSNVPAPSGDERALRDHITRTTYECVYRDKLVALPLFIIFHRILANMPTNPNAQSVLNFQLALAFVAKLKPSFCLMTRETALAFQQQFADIFDGWERELVQPLREYVLVGVVSTREKLVLNKLACFVSFHNVPAKLALSGDSHSVVDVMCELSKSMMCGDGILKIIQVIS